MKRFEAGARIRVLVVEDSITVRRYLVTALAADPEIEIVGETGDGPEAALLCEALRPDVVTLDMMLGRGTGVEVTERIMAYCPTPIVIVSASIERGEVLRTLDALAAGALEVIEKPSFAQPYDAWSCALRSTLKIASRVNVITHIRGRRRAQAAQEPLAAPPPRVSPSTNTPYRMVAVGASTGGPGAVSVLLGDAAFPIALPVLLVIHIGRPFGTGLVDWLRGVVRMRATEAADGEPLPAPGEARVIVAPPDRHLVVQGGRLRITSDPERHGCRPSVDVLFESVAREIGPGAIGCLLTGMGRDGAAGLLAMRQAGALTIAQDEASSVVFGMPREAIQMGAARYVLGLREMAPLLSTLAQGRGG